ncbi:MAG: sialidase family protein [Steroidobacteraceae bacterium]
MRKPVARMLCATLFAVGGVAFAAGAAPVAVSPAERHALAPEIAVGPRGTIDVIWLDKQPLEDAARAAAAAAQAAPAAAAPNHEGHGPPAAGGDRHLSSMDLWFARSSDGGASFGPATRVNAQSGQVWGFAVSKPKIAVGRSGTIHVVYPANAIAPAFDKPVLVMYYTRSTDGGATFEAPRRLHQLPDLDQSQFMDGGFTSAHAFGTVGVAPDGSVHAIWVDTRSMKAGDSAAAAYAAVSRDDGRTFTQEQVALPEGVCPCCQITIAFDARSRMYVGSRHVTGDGFRNSTVARVAATGSEQLGETVMIGTKAWKLEGCPLKPTVVAVDGRNIYTAAFNGAEAPPGAYFSMSRDGGRTFQPAFALHPDAAVSDAPALAVARGTVLVAWHAKAAGNPRRVYWRAIQTRSGRAGAVVELAAPEGPAQSPALATRPDGRVQVVWQQGERIYTTTLDPKSAPSATVASR